MTQKLTNVKMQPVYLNKDVSQEYCMPILRFEDEEDSYTLKMNLYIKIENKHKISTCRKALLQHLGRDIEHLKLVNDDLVQEYNEWKLNNETKKK